MATRQSICSIADFKSNYCYIDGLWCYVHWLVQLYCIVFRTLSQRFLNTIRWISEWEDMILWFWRVLLNMYTTQRNCLIWMLWREYHVDDLNWDSPTTCMNNVQCRRSPLIWQYLFYNSWGYDHSFSSSVLSLLNIINFWLFVNIIIYYGQLHRCCSNIY